MASLLLTAFPSARAVFRRTADADAAMSTQLAASGEVHRVLEAAGYVSTSGNSYTKGGQQIDLLVPAATSQFGTRILGGRAFDAAPGLLLALASQPIHVHADVVLTTGVTLEINVRLPRSRAGDRPKGCLLLQPEGDEGPHRLAQPASGRRRA